MTTDDRFERLERELALAKRHNRWLLAIVGMAVLMLVLPKMFSGNENAAQAQGKGSEGREIVANKFVLKDKNDRQRGLFAIDEDNVLLSLRDNNGKLRVLLDISDNRPGLSMFDDNGNPSIVVSVDERGSNLSLSGTRGKGSKGGIVIAVNENSPGMILFEDEINKHQVWLAIEKDRGPVLKMYDEKGKQVWSTL